MLIKFGDSSKDVSYCQGFSYEASILDERDADTYVVYRLNST